MRGHRLKVGIRRIDGWIRGRRGRVKDKSIVLRRKGSHWGAKRTRIHLGRTKSLLSWIDSWVDLRFHTSSSCGIRILVEVTVHLTRWRAHLELLCLFTMMLTVRTLLLLVHLSTTTDTVHACSILLVLVNGDTATRRVLLAVGHAVSVRHGLVVQVNVTTTLVVFLFLLGTGELSITHLAVQRRVDHTCRGRERLAGVLLLVVMLLLLLLLLLMLNVLLELLRLLHVVTIMAVVAGRQDRVGRSRANRSVRGLSNRGGDVRVTVLLGSRVFTELHRKLLVFATAEVVLHLHLTTERFLTDFTEKVTATHRTNKGLSDREDLLNTLFGTLLDHLFVFATTVVLLVLDFRRKGNVTDVAVSRLVTDGAEILVLGGLLDKEVDVVLAKVIHVLAHRTEELRLETRLRSSRDHRLLRALRGRHGKNARRDSVRVTKELVAGGVGDTLTDLLDTLSEEELEYVHVIITLLHTKRIHHYRHSLVALRDFPFLTFSLFFCR